MNDSFKKSYKYMGQLRSRYLNVLAAFKIFERFNQLSAINIVGKRKSDLNVKIFNKYRYFFYIIKESSRCYFLIELAKFFDYSKDSLQIDRIIKYLEKNISSLTKEDFIKFHKNKKISQELFKNYVPISLIDLNRFKKRIKRNNSKIENLKIYRDKYLAHDDIKKKKVNIKVEEAKVLLNIVKDLIELLYNKLDFSVNSYKNFKEEPIRDFDRMMESLIKCEYQRLDVINKKYLSKIKI